MPQKSVDQTGDLLWHDNIFTHDVLGVLLEGHHKESP